MENDDFISTSFYISSSDLAYLFSINENKSEALRQVIEKARKVEEKNTKVQNRFQQQQQKNTLILILAFGFIFLFFSHLTTNLYLTVFASLFGGFLTIYSIGSIIHNQKIVKKWEHGIS